MHERLEIFEIRELYSGRKVRQRTPTPVNSTRKALGGTTPGEDLSLSSLGGMVEGYLGFYGICSLEKGLAFY
jgi:hypothetical protein